MMSVLLSGGPVLWTIAVVGFAATVIFFLRFFDLRRAHVAYEDFMSGVENLIGKGSDREALAICDDTPAPVARVVAAAIRRRHEPPATIREVVQGVTLKYPVIAMDGAVMYDMNTRSYLYKEEMDDETGAAVDAFFRQEKAHYFINTIEDDLLVIFYLLIVFLSLKRF